MSFRYVWEKTHEAVRALTLSDGPLADRLVAAFDALLRLQSEQDFGVDGARAQFEQLLQLVGKAADEDRHAARIRDFGPSEQRRAGELMLALYSELERERGRREGATASG